MDIALTPELQRLIQRQVKSGKYASTSEVLLAGVRLLDEIESMYRGRYEELRQEVLMGVDAAERGEFIPAETVFERAQARLNEKRDRAT
ncbi:type II toxin-antitoxin system ParD family antitoxin [Synechococcus sp. PCC 7336]|uniref:type II toxin-antitoxin system ParD family antitoxin n=1 Tax=Synechococcus sp. PCC 7336 TaxID=195250 RepID=UPI00034D6498|nr:type II toxin-antitoxin system ParD family antitoxin [Synechococcus sp. PCC 7336]